MIKIVLLFIVSRYMSQAVTEIFTVSWWNSIISSHNLLFQALPEFEILILDHQFYQLKHRSLYCLFKLCIEIFIFNGIWVSCLFWIIRDFASRLYIIMFLNHIDGVMKSVLENKVKKFSFAYRFFSEIKTLHKVDLSLFTSDPLMKSILLGKASLIFWAFTPLKTPVTHNTITT